MQPNTTRPRRKRTPRFRETPDYTAGLCRQIVKLGERVGAEQPPSLVHIRAVEDAARGARERAVADLRAAGFTDADIGRALGTSRQNVRQRWTR